MKDSVQIVRELVDIDPLQSDLDLPPNHGVSPDHSIPLSPDYGDLSRLYDLIRVRKATTILEFGAGFSTQVMANALALNKAELSGNTTFKSLRRNNPFELHTIECSSSWLETALGRIAEPDRSLVQPHVSAVRIGTFCDRICGYYDSLPNISPDFIYLDGPSTWDVEGEVDGTHFRHDDRTIVMGDLLRLEPLFLPGTLIVVDGRTNNARFLRNNFQRSWFYEYDAGGDVHLFELRESPLGGLNARQLDFCLGKERWQTSPLAALKSPTRGS